MQGKKTSKDVILESNGTHSDYLDGDINETSDCLYNMQAFLEQLKFSVDVFANNTQLVLDNLLQIVDCRMMNPDITSPFLNEEVDEGKKNNDLEDHVETSTISSRIILESYVQKIVNKIFSEVINDLKENKLLYFI